MPDDALLREDEVDRDPIVQVRAWLADAVAAGVHLPEAVALATVSAAGAPSVRMVLLKEVDERGFVFFTNRSSRKGRELEAVARAALVAYWAPLGRQVRAEGPVAPVPDAESDAYFATRPRGSQIAAWASPQSARVAGRSELDRRVADAEARHGVGPVPRPPFWGGYRLSPEAIELWQHRESRLHDRLLYSRTERGWALTRLGP
ncbi:MAG: pyridoxamine 5'-phosphate oxidase [Thermoleophilia bacterium]|nr:pyridoxamine 5'-phosphate oxidase [Thermoleophilia bacterium]